MNKLVDGWRGLVTALVVIAVIATLVIVFYPGGGTRTVKAEFPRTVSLYDGSEVRILGVPVGKVTDVNPVGTKVVVTMTYDDKYKVPADAKAAIVSPSIVGDRFVQLTPVYKGGAVMADNAVLDEKHTATPLELDEIFSSLSDLSKGLGPNGANASDASGEGALTRLLRSTADNFGGQGEQFNTTLMNLGKLTKTLADNKDELFGSAREIEKFVNTLAKNDDTVRRFNDSLASGADLLADERQDLAAALRNLSVALTDVKGFVRDNRQVLTSNIGKLNRLTSTLVNRRDQLDEILKLAPAALNNLGLSYNPTTGTLDVRTNLGVNLANLTSDPLAVVCSFLAEGGGAAGAQLCNGLASNTGVANALSGLLSGATSAVGTGSGGLPTTNANRTGALAPASSQTPKDTVVEPVDRTLLGLVSR